MQYICDALKVLIEKGEITLEDLYTKKESDIVAKLTKLLSWEKFANAEAVISSDTKPEYEYSVQIDVKKRNVIPLININGCVARINEVSDKARKIYQEIENYQDKKYAYVRGLRLK